MSDTRLMQVAELHGLVGRQNELRELLDAVATRARDEPGCISFRVLTAEEPGEWVVLSEWVEEASLRAHFRTAHYRRYRDAVGPLLARSSDVAVHYLERTIFAVDPNPPDPERLG